MEEPEPCPSFVFFSNFFLSHAQQNKVLVGCDGGTARSPPSPRNIRRRAPYVVVAYIEDPDGCSQTGRCTSQAPHSWTQLCEGPPFSPLSTPPTVVIACESVYPLQGGTCSGDSGEGARMVEGKVGEGERAFLVQPVFESFAPSPHRCHAPNGAYLAARPG